ncbi:MAG: Fic family protein [Pseudanabaena sp.]
MGNPTPQRLPSPRLCHQPKTTRTKKSRNSTPQRRHQNFVKNHSFIDGNKRIGAACFLYFLQRNNILLKDNKPIIDNEALATLTLFIASSKTSESDTVKYLIISILNG